MTLELQNTATFKNISSSLNLDQRAEGDDRLLVAGPKPFHDVTAGKRRLEDH